MAYIAFGCLFWKGYRILKTKTSFEIYLLLQIPFVLFSGIGQSPFHFSRIFTFAGYLRRISTSDWYQSLRSTAGFTMADGSDSPHPNSGSTQDVSTLWAAIRALEEKFKARNTTIATDVRLILTQLEHLTVAATPHQPPPHFRAGDTAIPPLLVSPLQPLHL